jgi:hypothetical protein
MYRLHADGPYKTLIRAVPRYPVVRQGSSVDIGLGGQRKNQGHARRCRIGRAHPNAGILFFLPGAVGSWKREAAAIRLDVGHCWLRLACPLSPRCSDPGLCMAIP